MVWKHSGRISLAQRVLQISFNPQTDKCGRIWQLRIRIVVDISKESKSRNQTIRCLKTNNTKYTTSLLKLSLMALVHFNMTNFWVFECLCYFNVTIKTKLKICLSLHMEYLTIFILSACICSRQALKSLTTYMTLYRTH